MKVLEITQKDIGFEYKVDDGEDVYLIESGATPEEFAQMFEIEGDMPKLGGGVANG